MKLGRFLGLLLVVLVVVPFAHADGGTVTMVFTGVNGANNGTYYVSPYYGTMNGNGVVLFCDDINNEVSVGQTWTANVTNLGTALGTANGFANTRYGGVSTSAVYSNPSFAYEEAAWLTTQFASNPGDLVSLQYALWDIMNPGSEPTTYGDVQMWLNRAANFSSDPNFHPSDFSIVTNVGPVTLTGQVQEFIVRTPEPGTLALMACGLFALVLVTFLRQRTAA